MPPRLQPLNKCYPTIDLPILPFLAPRLFEPWPNRFRFPADAQTVRNHSMTVPLDYDNDTQRRPRVRKVCLKDQQHGEHSHDRIGEDMPKRNGSVDNGKPSLKKPGILQNGTSKSLISFPAPRDLVYKHHTGSSLERRNQARSSIKLRRRLKTFAQPRRESILIRWCSSNTPRMRHDLSSKQNENDSSGDLLLRRRRRSSNLKTYIKPRPSLAGGMRSKSGLYSAIQARNLGLSTSIFSLRRQEYRHLNSSQRMNLGKRIHQRRRSSLSSEILKWHNLMLLLEHIRPGLIDRRRHTVNKDPSTSFSHQSEINKLLQLESIEHLEEIWLALPFNRRMILWPELMVDVLAYHPEKAMRFLEATYMKQLPNIYVSDVLHCIITHHLRKPQPPSQDFVLDITNSICSFLLGFLPGVPPRLSESSIYLLIKNLPKMALKGFYLTLIKVKPALNKNTLFQFASRLAKGGETDLAFDISHRIKNLVEWDTPKFLSLCTTMLRNSQLDPSSQHRESDIFRLIQESGLTPNIITYNVLILNAVKDGGHETAWKIHDMMIDTGIETDEFTYSILLNDAKRRMDSSAMERVMSLVLERGLNNAHIFTDVLHIIHILSLFSKESSTKTFRDFGSVFEHMLQVYSEHFHMEPLIRMIPQLSGFVSPPSDPAIIQNLMAPAPATIIVMVTGFLHFGQASHAQGWYAHFRDLVISGDTIVEGFMEDTYIYNIILMTFRRHPELRNEAPNIIADMLGPTDERVEGAITSADQTDFEHIESFNTEIQARRPHTPPKPDVYTWTILLKIFMIQDHPRAAEKVLAMMARRGVKPDLVTWNNLVNGYSRLQDVERTADSVRRLESAGFKPDHRTYNFLSGVVNRKALSKALAQKKIVVETDFMEQLKQEILVSNMEKSEMEKKLRKVYV